MAESVSHWQCQCWIHYIQGVMGKFGGLNYNPGNRNIILWCCWSGEHCWDNWCNCAHQNRAIRVSKIQHNHSSTHCSVGPITVCPCLQLQDYQLRDSTILLVRTNHKEQSFHLRLYDLVFDPHNQMHHLHLPPMRPFHRLLLLNY